MRVLVLLLLLLVPLGACGGAAASPRDAGPADAGAGAPDAPLTPAWLLGARILVPGVGLTTRACRTEICPHNENTDLVRRGASIFLVHRTAESQILGPNSSLRVLRSDDGGATFHPMATIAAPADRDLRDPHFLDVGGKLAIEALTRLPVTSTRDSNVDTVSVLTVSSDEGTSWSPLEAIGPPTWSFWRTIRHDGVDYTAAYEDGDRSVKLFSASDGQHFTPGAVIYDVAADTPLETELVFMPSGRLLALVRMDGTSEELLGASGRLRTKVCWAEAPYQRFACPQELSGQRLDGPVAFFHGSRLFVVARKHLGADYRKRTALFELGGTLEGGPLTITELGELPSGGDTAYAGVAAVDADHSLVTWYSSSIPDDDPWFLAILLASDIWEATIDWTKVP